MKTEQEIEKRIALFELAQKRILDLIDQEEIKLKNSKDLWSGMVFFKQKEVYQHELGMINVQWAQLLWVLGRDR